MLTVEIAVVKKSQKKIRARADIEFNKARQFKRDKTLSDSIEFFRYCHEIEEQQKLEKKFNRILEKEKKKRKINKEFEISKSNLECIYKSKKKINQDVSNNILSYLNIFESNLIKYY
jgi:hypothetical protein